MSGPLGYNFEVKLLVKAAEVLEDGKPTKAVRNAFNLKDGNIKMAIQFLDTPDQVIYKGGWNLRVRISEDEDNFELTYKNRIGIDVKANPDPAVNINAAVTKAQQEGFDASSTFEAQVEYGYTSQTLSLSKSAEESNKGYDKMELPKAKESRKMLEKNVPALFNSVSAQGVGSDGPLSNAIVYGPVLAKRYVGKIAWKNTKVYLEVWPILIKGVLTPVVEASFKVKDLATAKEGQGELKKVLDANGWFEDEDILKTKLIMMNYGPNAKA